MKKLGILSALLLAVVFMLPVFAGGKQLSTPTLPQAQSSGIVPAAALPDASADPVGPSAEPVAAATDQTMEIKVLIGGKVETLSMSDYLFGAVAAEMPASFPAEALKAQAAAARTFAVNRMLAAEIAQHAGASVCDDPNHCLAYISEQTAMEKWGEQGTEYAKKVRDAVTATDGRVIYYQDQPIQAVFHAASSGKTERAADVWGTDIAYLQSVDSPGEEASPRYYGRVEITPDAFKSEFLKTHADAKLEGAPGAWFTGETRSAAGGIISMRVGGVSVSGNELRVLCALRSTNFTVSEENGLLIFKTIGYGHGVGMSQYGAQAMALSGKTFEEILKWYYTGATLGIINPEELTLS